jgi:hypothetical protein
MNYFTKKKILLWLLGGLLVFSVAALTGVSYQNYRLKHRIPPDTSSREFLNTELGLTDSQSIRIQKIRAGFRDSSLVLLENLKEKRSELVTEISKDNPDSGLINSTIVDIGVLQTRMLHQAVRQFIQIHSACDPGQKEKLSTLYFELFGCSKSGAGTGKGIQHRYRHGSGSRKGPGYRF